jgi:hypothetical protein
MMMSLQIHPRQWRHLIVVLIAISLVSCFGLNRNQSAATTTQTSERPFYALFDNTKAETAGNADWVVDATGRDPLRLTPVVPLPSSPLVETDWDGALSAWGVELSRSGVARVNSLPTSGRITFRDPTNPQDLSKYHVFVICEPNIDFTTAERRAIIAFIQNGGGLFSVADHTGSDRNNDGIDSPRIWNNLFRETGGPRGRFGLYFNETNIQREDPNELGDITDPDVNTIVHGRFGDVRGSIIRSGTDMVIDPNTNPAVRGVLFRPGAPRTGRLGVFAVLSRLDKGRIFAIGDSSPADDGTGDPTDDLFNGWRDPAGTNRELFLNATVWLAGSAVVSDEPTIIGITPGTAPAGRTATVLINARSSHLAPGLTTVSFEDGVNVNGVFVIDGETLNVNITVDPSAAGPRTISVITGSEVLQIPNGFVVNGL